MFRYRVRGTVTVPVETIVESDVPLTEDVIRAVASVREPRPMQSITHKTLAEAKRVSWVRSAEYTPAHANLSSHSPTEE